MDSRTIRLKFGRNYVADERTFMMGIDQRFTTESQGDFAIDASWKRAQEGDSAPSRSHNGRRA